MYLDRNATQNGAKRSVSAGMQPAPNAAWVLPQAANTGSAGLASSGKPALALLWSCQPPRTIGDYVGDREGGGRQCEQSFPSLPNPNLRFFHLI